jgi:hypothetical protein
VRPARDAQQQGVDRRREDDERGAVRACPRRSGPLGERLDRAREQALQARLETRLLGDGALKKIGQRDADDARGRGAAGRRGRGLHRAAPRHLTRMPGSAPESGETRKRPGPFPLAAKIIPSEMPKRILRGARFATTTA